MRVHKTLFYLMLLVFVAGIIVASIVEFSTVPSRIATGLISGALVGLLSTLVNYLYSWQSFFKGVFDNIFALFKELENELTEAQSNVELVNTLDKQTIINMAKPPAIEELNSKKLRERKYDDYRLKFDHSSYVPFFRSSNKTKAVLDELFYLVHDLGKIETYSIMKEMFVCLQEGHFSSEEEEKLCVGDDRDAFFDNILQSINDWRDYTGYMIRKLCATTLKLQHSLKPFILGEDYKELPLIMNAMAEGYLKGVPNRNPMDDARED